MKISNQTLTKLVHGAVQNVSKGKGYVVYYRCTDEQINHLKEVDSFLYDRTFFSASITIEFSTDATSFGFDHKIFSVGSLDSYDVYVNGTPYDFISLEENKDKSSIEIKLPEGHKNVVLYLPCDSEVGIKNFHIDGKWKKIPRRKENMICYGDSITQGYGSLIASLTYINAMNRQLNYEIVNHGIGGYWFDEGMIVNIDNFYPDKIVISLGTNQLWSSDKYERINKFFDKLSRVYPNVKTVVITPIWRSDKVDGDELIQDMRNYLFNVCSNYQNIHVIDGYELVPHIEYYYLDKLHPNGFGMEIYGVNLANKIKKIKW